MLFKEEFTSRLPIHYSDWSKVYSRSDIQPARTHTDSQMVMKILLDHEDLNYQSTLQGRGRQWKLAQHSTIPDVTPWKYYANSVKWRSTDGSSLTEGNLQATYQMFFKSFNNFQQREALGKVREWFQMVFWMLREDTNAVMVGDNSAKYRTGECKGSWSWSQISHSSSRKNEGQARPSIPITLLHLLGYCGKCPQQLSFRTKRTIPFSVLK